MLLFSLLIIFIDCNHGAIRKHSSVPCIASKLAYLHITTSVIAAKLRFLWHPFLPFFISNELKLMLITWGDHETDFFFLGAVSKDAVIDLGRNLLWREPNEVGRISAIDLRNVFSPWNRSSEGQFMASLKANTAFQTLSTYKIPFGIIAEPPSTTRTNDLWPF